MAPMSRKTAEEARAIMRKLGYGPDNRLAVKVSTRNIPGYRDPAVILISQLKEIYIDGELDALDTAHYFPKLHAQGLQGRAGRSPTAALDDPDQKFYENYVCGAERNYTGYCNPEFDKLIDAAIDGGRYRRSAAQLVWQIERMLAEDVAAAGDLLHARRHLLAAARSRGFTLMVNSLFNGWRMEDVWLDK